MKIDGMKPRTDEPLAEMMETEREHYRRELALRDIAVAQLQAENERLVEEISCHQRELAIRDIQHVIDMLNDWASEGCDACGHHQFHEHAVHYVIELLEEKLEEEKDEGNEGTEEEETP
jgi:hypothetical protein